MKGTGLLHASAIAIAVAALFPLQAASAQDAAAASTSLQATESAASQPSSDEPQSPASAGQVSDIIVTAQRRDESLQSVPISVAPVTGADLQTRKINDLTQIALAAPSFQTGFDNSYSIRGVGSAIFVPNVDSSVAVSVDEVSLGVPLFMSNGILDDVAQVEVLSGPQGLLFGRNASAGLLNIVSNRPRLGVFEGNVAQEFDWRDTVPGAGFGSVTKGTINIPISSTAALRVNGLYSYQDPVVKHIGPRSPGLDDNQTRLAGKAKLLWEPTDRFSIYLIGDYSRERGIAAIFDRSYRSLGATSVNTASVAADGIRPSADNLFFSSGGTSRRDVDTYGASANVKHEFNDWLTLSNIAAWRGYKLNLLLDTDFTQGNSIDRNFTTNSYNQYSDELRLAFNPGRLDGQIGLYYFQSKLRSTYELYANAYAPIPPIFDALLGQDGAYTQRNRSMAAFGQVQYELFDGFRVLAGGRVTDDHNRLSEVQNNDRYIVPGPFGPTFATPQRFTVGNTDFSYKVGAQYQVTPAVMIYGNYGKGYKGPSFNFAITGNTTNPVIRPESSHSAEAGIKSTLFDRRLRLNVSLFSSKFENFQVQSSDGVAFTTQSVADVKTRGVEFSATAKPFTGLTLNVGGTVLDSKFTNYPGAPCYPGQVGGGCGVGSGDSFNARGLRTPLAPKFTSTTQGIYEFPVGTVAKAFVQANWYHRSPLNFTYNGNPGTRLGTTDTIGASIGLRPTDAIEFTLFCKNCTDKRVPALLISDIFDANGFDSNTIVQSFNFDSVRTIGFTGSFRF